jgi:large subunit ribosomal protein L35
MPKLKTNKGAAKRFKLSKRGKAKMRKAGRGHLLTKKNSKRRRTLRATGVLDKTMVHKIKQLLPYGE